MADAFEQLMQLMLSALGMVAMPDVASLDLAALTLTVGVVPAGQGSAPHPLRAIDASTLLSQSDPDAPGHPRPRAPGVVRAV